ncbi:O-unit flippase [Vibrio breoganii]|uniref:flippase n=1 Tax=Vibrio breoganii TaxID=553239 RepID=UPI000C83F725|nr:flippase [Vibrio breoganii]PMM04233.1 O-unit flippase [Vibrio breoganii]
MLKVILTSIKHQGFIRYFINTSWMMAEQCLRIIAGLFVGIWVARYLGPEQFGLFSYALAFSAIFTGIAKLGLDGILVRELVNHPNKRDILLGTAFWLKVMGSLLTFSLVVLILAFTSNDNTTKLYIILITIGFFFQSFQVVELYFQSQVLVKTVSICKTVQLTVSSLMKIYLVVIDAGLIWFVLVTVLDTVSLAISFVVAYRLQYNPSFYKCFDLFTAERLLKDAWPLIISSVVIMVYMRMDQIMIKEMLGEKSVGIYSAAVRLSEALYFVPMFICTSLFPAILNAKKKSRQLYELRLQRLYIFMAWFAIILALPMTLLSDDLVALLYGEDYIGTGQVLMIHVWAAVFVYLGVASSKYLVAENLTKIAFKRTILGAVSNLILNFWLIPIHGAVGAAIATLIAQFVVNIFYDVLEKQLHQQLKMKIIAIFMPWKIYNKQV